MRRLRWRSLIVVALCSTIALGVASPAGARMGDREASQSPIASGKVGAKLKLRECWMTVMLVPRPEDVLESALRRQVDLSRSFYGLSEALLTTWTLSCERANLRRKRVLRNPILSLVAAPFGLVDELGAPLASNLAHAVVAVDANKRRLAKRLRRGGFPARKGKLRYRHSEPGVVPFSAELDVPGRYELEVEASTLDLVHDHQDTFEHDPAKGRRARMQLEIRDAVDRFCVASPAADCAAALSTPAASGLRQVLGAPVASVFIGIDHAKLPKVNLTLSRGR